MVNCPYLIHKDAKGCVNCLGWRCTAGREKKLSDVSVCQNEEAWRECAKYLSLQPNADEVIASTPPASEWMPLGDATPTPTDSEWTGLEAAKTTPVITASYASQDCPYLEYPPDNRCCSATCHAKDVRVAPRKNCRNYENCTRYLTAKLAAKPYRGET